MSRESAIKTKISPRAKKKAREKGLIEAQLLAMTGTGYDGCICEKDVLEYQGGNVSKMTPLAKKIVEIDGIDVSNIIGTGALGKRMKADVLLCKTKDTKSQSISDVHGKKVLNEIPYVGMRKIIGTRLSDSMFTAPHLYFTVSVDMENINEHRRQLNTEYKRKLSVTDLLVKAVGEAIEKNPMINSSLVEDRIIQYRSQNIGVAVALENGLIVPVIKDVQEKTVLQINDDTKMLIEKARNGRLMPEEYTGGTFTISNLGMFGIEDFTAIINPPESAILAVGGVNKVLKVITESGKDRIEIRPIMKITLSVDHRLIDGIVATLFLKDLKDLIENPTAYS